MNRRPLLGLLVLPGLVLSGGVSAWAYFGTTSTASQSFTAGTLGAAQTASAAAASTTGLTVSVTAGPVAPSPAAGGYQVEAAGQPITATPVCTITGATGSCVAGGLTASTTYSFDVYSTLQSWTSAAHTTLSGETLPDKPTGVTLANGGGTGNAYINSSNASSVSGTVTLPATTQSTDTVHLTATDQKAKTVTATHAGGTTTVTFTGLNLSTLADGPITFTAWATNAGGTGATTASTAYTKDTATVAAPTSLKYVDNSGSTADQITGTGVANDTINIAETSPATKSYSGTAAASGSFAINVDALNGTGNGTNSISYSYSVTQTDAAGNTSAATVLTGSDKS